MRSGMINRDWLYSLYVEDIIKYNGAMKYDKESVKAVQRFFGLDVTGLWDRLTTLAVVNWQLNRGLPATGALDENVQRDIVDVHQDKKQVTVKKDENVEPENQEAE